MLAGGAFAYKKDKIIFKDITYHHTEPVRVQYTAYLEALHHPSCHYLQ